MNIKNPKLIYILIGAFCVLAIIAGIYAQFLTKDTDRIRENEPNVSGGENQDKMQEEIKTQFSNLINNTFTPGNFDTSIVERRNSKKDIIYEAYNIQKQQENYEVDVHLPVVNIKGEVPASFNSITQSIFANKTSEVLKNKTDTKIIYSVNYVAYINEDILSVVIQSTLKEGSNPQRIIVQTYNYNLLTGEKVQITDVLAKKNILQSDCQNKINEVVQREAQEAQVLVQSGYTVYNRDLSNEMYQIENIINFFVGPNGELYIIFAYGNQNYTSEIDIVLYE